MKRFAMRVWKEEQGFLTFEWVMLVTLLSIGVVSGVASIRDATTDELGDLALAMLSLDQSYSIDNPLYVAVHRRSGSAAAPSWFRDRIVGFRHCDRTHLDGQFLRTDCYVPGVAPGFVPGGSGAGF